MLEFYSYKRWLKVSLAFHISIILIIILTGVIQKLFSRPVFISGGIGTAEPITIDVVGLPNVLKKDLALVDQEQTKKEPSQKKPDLEFPDNKKTIEKKSKLISQLKESLEQEQTYLKKIKIIKGLQVQKGVAGGTSTNSKGVGGGTSTDNVAPNPYFHTIKEHIRAYWKLPGWIRTDGLNTLITLKIADDGSIIDAGVSKSSGNQEFDKIALSSVKNAAPFPTPPVAVRDVLNSGIIISFP